MIKVIVIGPLKSKFIISGVNQYLKWIQPYHKTKLIEINLSGNLNNMTTKEYKDKDYKKFSKYISQNTINVVLDERGKLISSIDFSKKVENFYLSGKKHINFFIGGPLGHDERMYTHADLLLGLSKMTFTHEMAVLLTLEQIYRANKIIKNEKYHY